jgi:hypothetical protein
MVEPAVGALNQTSSEPDIGAGVADPVVLGVGVTVGVGVLVEAPLFAIVTLMRCSEEPPLPSYATTRIVYAPSGS